MCLNLTSLLILLYAFVFYYIIFDLKNLKFTLISCYIWYLVNFCYKKKNIYILQT